MAKAGEGTSTEAAQTGIDFSRFNRELNLGKCKLKGEKLTYAGFLLHVDKKKQPVVTWTMADLAADGEALQLFIDLNNDHVFTPNESFAPTTSDAVKAREDYPTYFAIPTLVVSGVKHTQFQMMVMRDPVNQGFNTHVNIRGDYALRMSCGWNQIAGKNVRMSDDMKTAPIYDFLAMGEIVVHCVRYNLPLQGMNALMFTLMSKGSEENAMSMLCMKRVPEADFKIEFTYPTENGPKTWKTNINHIC